MGGREEPGKIYCFGLIVVFIYSFFFSHNKMQDAEVWGLPSQSIE